jgi:RimJ/RimL family protein N-acetyltransferase
MSLGSDSSTIDPAFGLSIRPRVDLSDYGAWQVRNWQAQTFDLSEQFATVDWYVFGMRDGQWVSMLEITERTALVDQQPIVLALVGGVITVPDWRGHGYARAVLGHATTFFCQQRGVRSDYFCVWMG